MLRKAVTRIAATMAVALGFVAVSVTSGHAQATTGKIQGRVISSAGQPIASAQVSIDGTSLGNITNDEGFYFINEVPAGLHTIRAQSIGFRAVTLTGQRVLAGQTHTINFNLETAAVALEALVVTGERNPLVPRDQVSSKSIVTGETIDNLPLDNAASIITLQPGVITTNDGFSIRGSREGEHAVYVDGVPIRNLRSGATSTVELGTNSLAQVDVTTGGIAARFGNAQSGVINYVTRTGGSTFGGTVSFLTDRLAPEKIRGGFTRGELSLGGPVPGIRSLNFFAATTLEGNKYGGTIQGNPYPYYVPVGVDTVIRVARTAQITGATDSVDVTIPNFEPWNNGSTLPTGVSDEVNLTTKLSYGIGRGSKLDLTWYYNRDQSIGRGSGEFFNPEAWGGSYNSENMLTLGGYFLIAQTSERALALDFKASYQRDWGQSGDLDREWQEGHLFPAFGFNPGKLKFLWDASDPRYEITEEFLLAARSGVLPSRILSLQPGKENPGRQSFDGITQNLRINPYGLPSQYSLSGTGNTSQSYSQESRWYFNGQVDWQLSRWNRLWIGGELTTADSKSISVPLYDGTPSGAHFKPVTGGLFAQNRLDIGDVVLEAGVRMDYYNPDGVYPIVPGFVRNLPDSLKADAWTLRPGEEPYNERLVRVDNCGGAATEASRRRSDGTVVCRNNFIPAKTRTVFNPKLAVSFPVTATSTFRLSYNQNVQPVALNQMLSSALTDLTQTNTNATFGRDVDMPKTVLFEAGYRQVFGGNTVVDAAAYSKTNRNSLTYRRVQYEDPVSGQSLFLNSLTNADYSLLRGVDLRVDRKISEIADVTANYSFVDARGTGSDPNTYTGLILRNNTNLSVVTGFPIEAPEILSVLDQSRAHSVSGILSLQFANDYVEDKRIANAILGDLGVFATLRLASGLPFTKLENDGNGQTGPPTAAGLAGVPDESINASRGPGLSSFDLRLTKGVSVAGKSARLFVDARNPFNIANSDRIFLETGTINNDDWYERALAEFMQAQTGYGAVGLVDQVISAWPNQNAVNQYMLRKAEERFGNGDGIFTAAEQRSSWETYFRTVNGNMPYRMRQSHQSLRLGVEVVF